MEQIEQLVNAVTFDKLVPNFTTEIKTKNGFNIDTMRYERMFGRTDDSVFIHAKQEAMALACALLAQCHKLHELDAPKAEPTSVHFDAMAHGHLITERAPSDDEQP